MMQPQYKQDLLRQQQEWPQKQRWQCASVDRTGTHILLPRRDH
jgi:hypothetical protein